MRTHYTGKGPKCQTKLSPEAWAKSRAETVTGQIRTMRGEVAGLKAMAGGRRYHIVNGDCDGTHRMYQVREDENGRDKCIDTSVYEQEILFRVLFGDDDDERHDAIMAEWEREEATFNYDDLVELVK